MAKSLVISYNTTTGQPEHVWHEHVALV